MKPTPFLVLALIATSALTLARGTPVINSAAKQLASAVSSGYLSPSVSNRTKAHASEGQARFVRSDFPSGASSAASIALGDFNGDGIADIVMSNSITNTVSVLLGNSDGTFQAGMQFATAYMPGSVVLGDFNGDGKLDIAVADECGVSNICGLFSTPAVSILLGNGDGTFQSHMDVSLGIGGIGSMAIGDFNGDGIADIAAPSCDPVTYGCPGNGLVYIVLGNKSGNFGIASFTGSGGSYPTSVVVADFNGDGIPDLATTDYSGWGIVVSLGIKGGGFRGLESFSIGPYPQAITSGDFNRDGFADIAVALNSNPGSVAVAFGNGDGTFESPSLYLSDGTPTSVTAADFNGDGIPDLAITNLYTNNVSVLLGAKSGNGTFPKLLAYNDPHSPSWAVTGFLNGNARGSADIVSSDYDGYASVFLNTGATHMVLTSSPNPSQGGQPVTFTTTVAAAANGLPAPTGTVKFNVGTGHVQMTLENGMASYTTSSLPTGKNKVTAAYSGSGRFNSNTAGPITQVVD